MSLKVGNWIELTFKEFMLRGSEGKRMIKRLGETQCGLGPGLAPALRAEIAPEWSQGWRGGELLFFPSHRSDGKFMAGL